MHGLKREPSRAAQKAHEPVNRGEIRRGMVDANSSLQTLRKRLDIMNDQAVREKNSPGRPMTARIDPMVARVAIADDDPEALELLGEILRGPAIEICKAASGAELVVLLAEQGPFDLIVTDIDMPWMEGLAVIRSARASEIQAPVLFVSGLARPDLPAAVERLGNARLLRKPIAVSTLRKTVSEMLRGVS
jgi:FOG: CheY-like receiver